MPNAVGEDVGHATLCPTYLAGYADLRESGEGGVWVMNAEWQEIRLGDVSKIRRGSSPRPIVDFLSDEGMPWVKISDATESESRFITKTKEFIREEGVEKSVIVREGDLILSNSGTAGLPKFMGITACIHDGWQVFKELNGIDKEFLYYTLLNIRRALLHNAYDNVLTNLTLDMLRDAKVRLPSLPIQREISSILLSLDEKIELNRKQNRTLEAIAQALFKRWFVEFEFPDENGQPYKSSGGAMQPSELGEIPVGWEVRSLAKITNYLGRGLTPVYIEEGGVSVLNQRCIRDGWISSAPARRHDSTVRKTDGRELRVGDVLVNSTGVGTLGRVAQVVKLNEPTVVDSHVTVVRPNLEKLRREYLGVNLRLREREIECMAEGTTGQTELSRTKLGELPIIIPDPIRQNLFADLASSINAKRVRNWQESIALASIRDTLLPKLMSGELRVGELESDMEIEV